MKSDVKKSVSCKCYQKLYVYQTKFVIRSKIVMWSLILRKMSEQGPFCSSVEFTCLKLFFMAIGGQKTTFERPWNRIIKATTQKLQLHQIHLCHAYKISKNNEFFNKTYRRWMCPICHDDSFRKEIAISHFWFISIFIIHQRLI